MSIAINRICEIPVACEYTYPDNGLVFEFGARVLINHNYEVEAVELNNIEVYDVDELLTDDVAGVFLSLKGVRENLETLAGVKALEKCQAEDFAQEAERD